MSDAINPTHYNELKPEPITVIQGWNLNFCLGNAIKYVARAGRKGDDLEDLKKAKRYLEFEIEARERQRAAKSSTVS